MSPPQKEAEKAADKLAIQESQVFSLELAIKEENPIRGALSAAATLSSHVENLRDSNHQVVQENGGLLVRQEEELISRKKTHALFFKELSTQIEALQQTTSQTLPSWTNQAFPLAVARDSRPGCIRYKIFITHYSPFYAQGAASCQHRLTLLCNDIVRLAKEADLFTSNS